MRYGVISDIHGNLRALEAVLAALERARVDAHVCPGDVVGYGPRPNECAARVRDLGATVVAGNHDLMALGELSADGTPARVRESTAWTSAALDEDTRAWLAGLPRQATLDDGAVRVLVAHGSLDDSREYVRGCRAAATQLTRLRELDPTAGGLLLGHTHQPLACGERGPLDEPVGGGAIPLPRGERWVLNAGSVGQARERRPLARALVLDTAAGRAERLALDYDAGAVEAELRAAGLPPDSHHLRPRPLRRIARRMRARAT